MDCSLNIPSFLLQKHNIEVINKPDICFIKEKNKEYKDKSFFVYDYAKVVKKLKNFKMQHEKMKPFYEVKANNDSTLLEILSYWNLNFACVSLQEVKMVRAVSTNPIMVTSPVISESELKELCNYNVEFFLVDNLDHLQMINKYHPKCHLLIYAVTTDEKRFGADLVKTSLILNKSKEYKIKVDGVYINIKKQEEVNKRRSFILDIKALFKFYDFDFNFLLINQEALDFYSDMLDIKCEIYSLLNSIICENYIMSSEIINSVKIDEEKKEIKYYLTNGDLHLGRFYNDLEQKFPTIYENEKNSTYTCTIYGPTGDTSDFIVKEFEFSKMKITDHILFENIGYSSLVFSGSCFNGLTEDYIHVKLFNQLNE